MSIADPFRSRVDLLSSVVEPAVFSFHHLLVARYVYLGVAAAGLLASAIPAFFPTAITDFYKLAIIAALAIPMWLLVFGPSGRILLSNAYFGSLGHLSEAELAAQPHFSEIAVLANARIGYNPSWDIICEAVNAANNYETNSWRVTARGTHKAFALSLARLPNGAVIVCFTDLTDLEVSKQHNGKMPENTLYFLHGLIKLSCGLSSANSPATISNLRANRAVVPTPLK